MNNNFKLKSFFMTTSGMLAFLSMGANPLLEGPQGDSAQTSDAQPLDSAQVNESPRLSAPQPSYLAHMGVYLPLSFSPKQNLEETLSSSTLGINSAYYFNHEFPKQASLSRPIHSFCATRLAHGKLSVSGGISVNTRYLGGHYGLGGVFSSLAPPEAIRQDINFYINHGAFYLPFLNISFFHPKHAETMLNAQSNGKKKQETARIGRYTLSWNIPLAFIHEGVFVQFNLNRWSSKGVPANLLEGPMFQASLLWIPVRKGYLEPTVVDSSCFSLCDDGVWTVDLFRLNQFTKQEIAQLEKQQPTTAQLQALLSSSLANKHPSIPSSQPKTFPSPEAIKKELDKQVIGQEDAKEQLAISAYHRQIMLEGEPPKSYKKKNVLLIGPSGSGKTLLVEKLSNLLGVPYTVIDASRITPEGYIGESASEGLFRLLDKANGDKTLAENGIVFIDELDKISYGFGSNQGTEKKQQVELLKLLEGAELWESPRGSALFSPPRSLNTKNLLFICAGAFTDITQPNGVMRDKDDEITPEILINEGNLMRELVARIPSIARLDDLTKEDIKRLLANPNTSPFEQQREVLLRCLKAKLPDLDQNALEKHLKFEVEDQAYEAIAEETLARKLGARGLEQVINKLFNKINYLFPGKLEKETFKAPPKITLKVTKKHVEDKMIPLDAIQFSAL